MTTHDWVEINDGVDRQRDYQGGLYAQAGPETLGRWSWAILRHVPGDEADFVVSGIVRGGEVEAIAACERAYGDLVATGGAS